MGLTDMRVVSMAKDEDGNLIACAVEEGPGPVAAARANDRLRQQLEAREAGLAPEMDDPGDDAIVGK